VGEGTEDRQLNADHHEFFLRLGTSRSPTHGACSLCFYPRKPRHSPVYIASLTASNALGEIIPQLHPVHACNRCLGLTRFQAGVSGTSQPNASSLIRRRKQRSRIVLVRSTCMWSPNLTRISYWRQWQDVHMNHGHH
jgi:hypothetical protein